MIRKQRSSNERCCWLKKQNKNVRMRCDNYWPTNDVNIIWNHRKYHLDDQWGQYWYDDRKKRKYIILYMTHTHNVIKENIETKQNEEISNFNCSNKYLSLMFSDSLFFYCLIFDFGHFKLVEKNQCNSRCIIEFSTLQRFFFSATLKTLICWFFSHLSNLFSTPL